MQTVFRAAAMFAALLSSAAIAEEPTAAPPQANAPAVAEAPQSTWLAMKGDLFGDRALQDGAAIIALQAPVRALDAAVTPITIVAKRPQSEMPIKSITLIVDENPSPVVAKLSFGPAAVTASVSTRIRVDNYSWIRVVAELPDGSLHMVQVFVKASGGCSAPSLKDEDAARAEIGRMQFRQFARDDGGSSEDASSAFPVNDAFAEAQIAIRHPNYSGLQMNQATMLYIPAFFVNDIEVSRGGETIFRLEGGISLSENPTLRFQLARGGTGDVMLRATDTDGGKYEKNWPVKVAER